MHAQKPFSKQHDSVAEHKRAFAAVAPCGPVLLSASSKQAPNRPLINVLAQTTGPTGRGEGLIADVIMHEATRWCTS